MKCIGQDGTLQINSKRSSFSLYISKQEGKSDCCEWVSFPKDDGDGICIAAATSADDNISKSTFSFSALLHSGDKINAAAHTCDLVDSKNGKNLIHVNIDHQLMGVGRDVR